MPTPMEDVEERARTALDAWLEAGRRLRALLPPAQEVVPGRPITPWVLTDELLDAFVVAVTEFEQTRAAFHESLVELQGRLGPVGGWGLSGR